MYAEHAIPHMINGEAISISNIYNCIISNGDDADVEKQQLLHFSYHSKLNELSQLSDGLLAGEIGVAKVTS